MIFSGFMAPLKQIRSIQQALIPITDISHMRNVMARCLTTGRIIGSETGLSHFKSSYMTLRCLLNPWRFKAQRNSGVTVTFITNLLTNIAPDADVPAEIAINAHLKYGTVFGTRSFTSAPFIVTP